MKKIGFISALNFSVIISLLFFSFCNQIATSKYVISDKGLPGIIEIGMTLDDLKKAGFNNFKELKREFDVPKSKVYSLPALSSEFEVNDGKIIRIWFFSNKKADIQIYLTINKSPTLISKISAKDIIKEFGEVKVYETEYKEFRGKLGRWFKYDPFKVGINTIDYPNYPYLFYFDKNNMIKYITISQRIT